MKKIVLIAFLIGSLPQLNAASAAGDLNALQNVYSVASLIASFSQLNTHGLNALLDQEVDDRSDFWEDVSSAIKKHTGAIPEETALKIIEKASGDSEYCDGNGTETFCLDAIVALTEKLNGNEPVRLALNTYFEFLMTTLAQLHDNPDEYNNACRDDILEALATIAAIATKKEKEAATDMEMM